MKRSALVLLVTLTLALAGGAGYWGVHRAQAETAPATEVPPTVAVTRGEVLKTITAPGKLVSARTLALAPETGGVLAEVTVRPGDTVKAGTVLARLKTADLERAVAQKALELEQAQLVLDKLERPATAEELAVARAEVQHATQALKAAGAGRDAAQLETDTAVAEAQELRDQRYNRYLELQTQFGLGQIPEDWVKNAYRAYTAAQTQLEIAQRNARSRTGSQQAQQFQAQSTYLQVKEKLHTLENGPTAEQRREAALRVRQAQLALEQAQAQLAAATLIAPFDGVVLEVKAQAGEPINAGSPLISLYDPTTLEAQVEVIEEDLPLLQPGQLAELLFDAQPDLIAQGRVAQIVPQRLPGDRPLYPVVLVPTEPLSVFLVPGMNVDATITVGQRADVLRLPRSVVKARNDGTATVTVWANGQTEERTIQVGLRGDHYVEILAGLQEGETVVAQ